MQLVINTFGASLRRKGDRFIVKAGSKQQAISAHKVQSILATTGVYFSSDAVALAVRVIGKGAAWADQLSLMPEDNLHGWRTDVAQAIKAS